MRQLTGEYWVARADALATAVIEQIAHQSPEFWTVSQTPNEVSIVSTVSDRPEFTSVEGPWSVFGIVGTLDFALTGILSRCSTLLAEAGISVFAVSTYDTDYFLVRKQSVVGAIEAWRAGGVEI